MMKADAVVVLGGGVEEDGTPTRWTDARLRRGLELVAEGVSEHLVVSGGWGLSSPRPIRTEAEVMAGLAVRQMDPSRVHLETESRDTIGNAWFTGKILRRDGWRSILIVTSDFHVPRAAYVFSRLLPDVLCACVAVQSELEGTQLHRLMVEEAVIRTFLGEWIGGIPPGDNAAFANFIAVEHPAHAENPRLTIRGLDERLKTIRASMLGGDLWGDRR